MSDGHAQMRSRIAIAVTVTCVFVLARMIPTMLSFPVYVDELLFKGGLGRYWIDGVSNNLMPQCGSGWRFDPPLLTLPLKWIEGQLWGNLEPFDRLRWIGVPLWIFSLLSLGTGLRRWSPGRESYLVALPILLGFFGLIPLAGSLSRPELLQTFFGSLWFMAVSFAATQTSVGNRVSYAVCSVLFGYLAATAHVRSILFSPAFLGISSFLMLPRGRWKLLTIIFVLPVTASVYKMGQLFTYCPDHAPSEAFNLSYVLTPKVALSNPGYFLRAVTDNLLESRVYMSQMVLPGTYPLQWMPNGLKAPKVFRDLGKFLYLAFFFGAAPLALHALRKNLRFGVGALLVLAGSYGVIALGTIRAWYQSPLIIVSLGVVFLTCLAQGGWTRTLKAMAFLLVVGSVWSTSLVRHALRPFDDQWQNRPALAYTESSIAPRPYEDFRSRHADRATTCMREAGAGPIFLVDVLTFPLFGRRQIKHPVFNWFINGPGKIDDAAEVDKLYRSTGVSGAYASCQPVLDAHLSRVNADDGVCCYKALF